jgi:tetratricopeptide (TPR) repeat protein
MSTRLEKIRQLLEMNPTDSRTRYMMAMEMANTGDLAGAVKEYEVILAADADYGPAYYHGGQTLEKLGETDRARDFYARGIEATARSGDHHTRGELEAALAILG